MGTVIRPELSKENKYWIERHRYYELKHFCLQYPIWKKMREALINIPQSQTKEPVRNVVGKIRDVTGETAISREYFSNRIEMVENAAKDADCTLAQYLLKGVTEGISYDLLRLRMNIPCSKDVYYEVYRRFFWILDKLRQ